MATSTDPTAPEAPGLTYDQSVLREIARRVRWLSAAIVDAANADRANHSGIKVGGHQASSASMADIMVALWGGDGAPLCRLPVSQLPAG
jgi:pyruvate dehydrogenase E1 component